MFSNQVGYAIRCLVYLAERDTPALIKDISEAENMPYPFLSKIVNILAKKGFVTSQRGIGGGITLAKKPQNISIYNICLALDEPLLQLKCLIGMPECSARTNCSFHSFWAEEKERILNHLKQNTISQVAATTRKNRMKRKVKRL